jgi:hypothetical protein
MAPRGGKPEIAWSDDALRIANAVIRKLQKSGGTTKGIDATTDKIRGQMAAQGKKGVVKQFDKYLKGAMKNLNEQSAAQKKLAQQEADKRLIAKGGKAADAATLGEAAGRKGSVIRGGEEVPVSRRDAANFVQRGNLAGAAKGKGNANLKTAQQQLSRVANDKSVPVAKRREARIKLRDHQRKHGNFLK